MKKHVLNMKRLTKGQVRQLIENEGSLHNEYTKEFEEVYGTGHVKRHQVYQLPNDRFLYVFDENESSIGGKGDIYPGDYFRKFVKWHQRVREDSRNNRGSSVDHWRFYSKYKAAIVEHTSELVTGLSFKLNIESGKLDNSYKSLDIVSEGCQAFGLDNIIHELYDNLVIYTGNVIKERVNGHWEINKLNSGGDYPFIGIEVPNVQYMAVNVVWDSLTGLEDIDLRRHAAAEVRLRAPEVKMQRFLSQRGGKLDASFS